MVTAWRAAGLVLAAWAAASVAAAQDETTPEMAALDAALAHYGAAGDAALIEEALHMRVLAGELAQGQAASELASRSAALQGAAADPERRADLLAEHREAMEHLFAVIEKAIRSAPQWPADRTAEEYASLATAKLELLRDDYNAALRQGDDPTPVVAGAEALLALTRGAAALPATAAEGGSGRSGRRSLFGAGGDDAAAPEPPLAAGAAATDGSLVWRDMLEDKVGPWGQGTPDGQPDGRFTLLLHLPDAIEIAGIGLYSADAAGTPAGGQAWHSGNTNVFVLGVHSSGAPLNTAHVPSLGVHRGYVAFELYAANSGWFNAGQPFVVEVTFADGSKWSKVAVVDAPPGTDGQASTDQP